jgi:tetratricopeptide (TPR) repeat protein
MPGHIYAQSDKIDEAIGAFRDAAVNELSYLNADVLYPNGHHGHNVHFLVHSLNLDGRYQDSMAQVRKLMEFRETPRERAGNSQRTPYRQGYFSLIKTLVRFERWDLILDGQTIPVYDKPEQQAWRTWATGIAYSARGDADKARAAQAEMRGYLKNITASKRALTVAELELDGAIQARAGDRKKGYALYKKAAEMEAALIYTEPPSYPRPAIEGFGQTALALNDFKVAEKAFREALSREPGSGRAYFGLAASLRGLNNASAADAMVARARAAWDKADSDLPQLRAAVATTGGGHK